jgi:arsenate reductase-like glutaredoxin family protein
MGAAPVAAPVAAVPEVRAAVPAPRQPAATPPTPVQFTTEEIMDPESTALEQQAAAVLEQERARPIQAAADAQTREFIRTRAARIADLQKATVARDPAKIQAALDSLRMLKEPILRQPRAAQPEPAALAPGSEGYGMSQLFGRP